MTYVGQRWNRKRWVERFRPVAALIIFLGILTSVYPGPAAASTSGTWVPVPGKAVDVSVGSGGEVWVINASQDIFRRDNDTWVPVAGKAVDVSVGSDGEVWAINASDNIYRRDGSSWQQIPGKAVDVSVGSGGDVWVINASQDIFRRDNDTWVPVAGKAVDVSVGSDGEVWAINASDNIYRRDGSSWQQIAGKAVDVSVGSGGDVWVINAAQDIFRRDNDTWVPVPGKAVDVSVGSDGEVWVLNNSQDILTGEGFNETPTNTDWCDVADDFETCNDTVPAQPPAVSGLLADGECSAVVVADGSTIIIWDDPPADSALFAAARDLTPVGSLGLVNGQGLRVDASQDWAGGDPGYIVRAYNADTSQVSAWVACTPVTFSPDVADDLTDSGLPVTSSGDYGSDDPGGLPEIVSYPGRIVKNTPLATSPSVCSAAGLRMDVPAAWKDNPDTVSGTLNIPAGATVTADFVHHKSNTSTGNMGGYANIYRINPDETLGERVARRHSESPNHWPVPGDVHGFDDEELFTNTGETERFAVVLEHGAQGSINYRDKDPHYRLEDFRFKIDDREFYACPPTTGEECVERGGNFVVTKHFVYDGESYGPGCYTRESCVADNALNLGSESVDDVSEWSCNNDELLDVLLAAALIVVVATGGYLLVGPAAVTATEIGLVSSLWVCDTSDNGALNPAPELGSLDPACTVTNTAVSTGAGGGGALFAGSKTAASLTFSRTVAVSCGIGASEEAIATTVIGYASTDQQTDVTDTAVASALGCATGGIAGGTTKLTRTKAAKAIPEKLDDALKTFTPKQYQVGGSTIELNKTNFGHILERHHPKYFTGEPKTDQTFFEKSTSVSEIQNAIDSVVQQRGPELADIAAGNGWGQVNGVVVDGKPYTLGTFRPQGQSGTFIRQFFPE